MFFLFGGQMIETPLQNQELKLIHLCPLVIFLGHLPGARCGFRAWNDSFKNQTICTLSKTKLCCEVLSSSFLRMAFFRLSLHFSSFC